MKLEDRLRLLAEALGLDHKALVDIIGNPGALTTQNKANLVAAINELRLAVATNTSIDDSAPSGTKTYSSTKIISTINAALADLVNGAPAAFDTLKELADALNADQGATQALITAVGYRIRYDAAMGLNAAQMGTARGNIGAASADDVGNTDHDFVSDYNAAKA